MCYVKIYVLYSNVLLYVAVVAQDPVANIPQGRIVGIKVFSEESRTPIEIYFGVPYAVAPVGRFRFSAPERHPGWRRTFFAHRMQPHCPHEGDPENEHSAEDCLYLNICTPRPADGFALPVIVIFYSESWTQGGPTLPCQELASEGIVVVTVTYRLHVLAFFTLRLISARGNLALLDQYLALLWVRDNIAAFGGDPTAITVLGHSAGADSILYHLASPRSTGLFQRAILMSPQYLWKIIIDEQNASNATEVERISREIAHALGCHSENDQETLSCMRNRPLNDILSVYTHASWSAGMKPATDQYLPQSEQYLPTTLLAALSSMKPQIGHIDLLFGTADLEALSNNDKNYEELMKQSSSNISNYTNRKAIPEILKMFSFNGSREMPMLTRAIRWEYWNENNEKRKGDNLDSIEKLARIESSVRWGVGGALLAAKLARRYPQLYVYRYSQPGGVDLHGRQFNFSGAVHGADLVSLLGNALMLQVARRPATNDEKRATSRFRQHIINFAKYGSPGSADEWRQYRVGGAQICDIRDKSYSDYFSASKDIKFWLQYLPELVTLISSFEGTEQLSLQRGENRLRGGVFAMCGVSTILLLLLAVCAILLRRHRSGRYSVPEDSLH